MSWQPPQVMAHNGYLFSYGCRVAIKSIAYSYRQASQELNTPFIGLALWDYRQNPAE